MKVRFIGSADPTENLVCEAFGQSFPKGKWQDVPDNSTLSGNPTFEVKADGTAAPADIPADPTADPEVSSPE